MTPDIDRIVAQEHQKQRAEQPRRKHPAEFSVLGDDRYRLSLPEIAVSFEVDRLRREHNELIGELSVRCDLPGALTFDGSLNTSDFNFSSARARTDRAKLLAARANTKGLDWIILLEEFCQRVLQTERNGQPAVDLRTLEKPAADDLLEIEGLALLRRHPSMIFGDGGSAKSYLALHLAGRLAQRGTRVGLFDWELAGEDHRDRLERLFPDGMPQIQYVRCERPLTYETDRLRRIVRDHRIEFSIFDSVAFATDGPPEAAEVAGRYFRAVRQIGGGSLHLAHISKAENGDQKPFGSAFWHNMSRATWFVKKDEASEGTDVLRIGLFNRKSNLGRLRPPLGYSITFGEQSTTFRRADVAASPDLAEKMTVRQRMAYLLLGGSMTIKALAEEMDTKFETIERTAYRNKSRFIVLEGGKVGLLERNREDR